MSLFAGLVLAAAATRVDAVYLTSTDQKLAVRVALRGAPAWVAVQRSLGTTHVTIHHAELGGPFACGRHFSWTRSDGLDPALVAAARTRLDRIEVTAVDSHVALRLQVPADAGLEVRRDTLGLLLVFQREPQALASGRVASAAGPPQEPAKPEGPPPPAQPPKEVPAPTPAPAPADDAELMKRLFPDRSGETATGESVSELYPRLFPAGGPEPAQPEAVPDVPELGEDEGALLGPVRLRASVDVRYVDADTFVTETAQPTRDTYLELQPRVQAATPVGAGAFRLEYAPVVRAFASHDQVNSNSHLLGGTLELPVGARVTLRARDQFQSGVLDTRVVDPGGEYFFGLGRFRRNDLNGGASVMVGARLSVELAGGLGNVHFVEDSSFFDYETRLASAGLGFELTPNLRAVGSYVYDEVPRPDERPEAESTAHSVRLALTGDILPLLTGELAVGYRSQEAPNAGPGGQSYSGLTFEAALQREFARGLRLSLYGTRSTPVSAFDANAFYVSTGVRGVLEVPLPARFEARGGLGYQWNDYKTIAEEIGAPREDRIFGWFVGLRRPIARQLWLSAAYREELRRSNIPTFETDADGLYLQLEWEILGRAQR